MSHGARPAISLMGIAFIPQNKQHQNPIRRRNGRPIEWKWYYRDGPLPLALDRELRQELARPRHFRTVALTHLPFFLDPGKRA